MKKITVIIVDDETRSRSVISKILAEYCPEVNVVGEAASVVQAIKLMKGLNPELVLLDIEMPKGTGFDFLNSVDKSTFEVIFITGFDSYALQAIKAEALDYILKPVDIEELQTAVLKAINRIRLKTLAKDETNLSNIEHQKITIPQSGGKIYIKRSDIVRCRAEGVYTWIYVSNNKSYFVSKNLGEFEKLLCTSNVNDQNSFFRIHHKEIINISYIKSYERGTRVVEMEDGSTISIAQRRVSQFVNVLKLNNLY